MKSNRSSVTGKEPLQGVHKEEGEMLELWYFVLLLVMSFKTTSAVAITGTSLFSELACVIKLYSAQKR